MNYEQKYNEALDKLKKGLAPVDGKEIEGVTKSFLEEIFPELKESEDEKIRKELINFFSKGAECDSSTNGIKDRNIIAWLEKQSEQKAVEYSLEQAAEIFLDSLAKTPYNNKPVTDAQVITKELLKFLSDTNSYNPNAINEQKPTWSEDDEKMLRSIRCYLNEFGNWISDKNEEKSQSIYKACDWLKSHKPNHWKPSEEQMEALNAINTVGELSYFEQGDLLVKLYQDLKNL